MDITLVVALGLIAVIALLVFAVISPQGSKPIRRSK